MKPESTRLNSLARIDSGSSTDKKEHIKWLEQSESTSEQQIAASQYSKVANQQLLQMLLEATLDGEQLAEMDCYAEVTGALNTLTEAVDYYVD